MLESNEHSEYKTVRVGLKIQENLLAAYWRFPNNKADLGYVSIDLLQNWMRKTYLWEEKTRSSDLASSSSALAAMKVSSEASIYKEGFDTAHEPSPTYEETIEDFLERTGKEIYSSLCPQEVRICWNEAFRNWQGQPIRIVFELARDMAKRIAAIPIETMSCDTPGSIVNVHDSFAKARWLSIVRRVGAAPDVQPQRLDVDLPLHLLVFASNPKNLPERYKLNVQDEVDAIKQAVKNAGKDIEVKEILPGEATFGRLRKAGPQFHVLHFIGHGEVRDDGTVQLLLEDESGGLDWRDASEITNVLLNTKTQLIVLNGCRTAAISVFACQFPAVVGMQFRISDEAATNFAKGLYSQLAETGQLDDAVWQGRQNITEGSITSRWEYRTPVLYMQSEDGLLLRIRPRILTDQLPDGTRDSDYIAKLAATGGRKPHVWWAEGLPTGLSIDEASGVISGLPQVAGVFSVVVGVQSRDELKQTRELVLVIKGSTVRILTEQIG